MELECAVAGSKQIKNKKIPEFLIILVFRYVDIYVETVFVTLTIFTL